MNRTSVTPARALLLTGTVGSGKTSVADTIGDLLSHAGIANAVIDVDWLRRSWPCPPEDPFNGELDRILEQAQVEDVVVDATTTSIRATAEAVMAAVDW